MEAKTNKILIVEDDLHSRKILELLLRGPEYTTVAVDNGFDAVAVAVAEMPDLILLDVLLPGINGFEICRQLRATAELSEVPIIMVTALGDSKSRLEAMQAGADDFVSKPFNRVELQARIHAMARLNAYRQQVFEQAKFEQMVQLSPDGVMIVDGDGRIQLTNPAAVAMLGRGEAALDGALVADMLIDAASGAAFADCLQTAVQQHRVCSVELSFLQPAGAEVIVEVTIGVFAWQDKQMAQLVMHDITERKRLELRLQARNEELLRVSEQLVAVHEVERQVLARELQDDVGQSLTGLQALLDKSRKLPANEVSPQLAQAQALLASLTEQVQELSQHLRPAMLEQLGLRPVLAWYFQRFRVQTGIRVVFDDEVGGQRFVPEVETAVYRIVQESLTNVARHTTVSEARVRLFVRDGLLHLVVADVGPGFNLDKVAADSRMDSLLGLQMRTRTLGGDLQIDTKQGAGTRLYATLPAAMVSAD